MSTKLSNMKIRVTEDILRQSEMRSTSKCAIANAIRAGAENISTLKVGVRTNSLQEGVMPYATWYTTTSTGTVMIHYAEIEPREQALALITLNDTDRGKAVRLWHGDMIFRLVNHTAKPQQDKGGTNDDPIRRKVRDYIRANPDASDNDVAAVMGCTVAKVKDTRKRMIPGPIRPRKSRPRMPRRLGMTEE
jgi:hypothetical protein